MKPMKPAVILIAILSGLALPRPVRAQDSDDFSTTPIPQEVRKALERREETPPLTGGTAVLQEGPVDPATYRLGAGDELTVHYTGRTSVTHRLVVSPEGDVYLPDVGTVDLAGVPLKEGKERIRAAAQRILRNVRVDVSLTRLRSFKISVGGEVRFPGVYAATAVTRVNELLRDAGGLTDSAAVRDIRLQGPETDQVLHVDLLPFLLQGRLGDNNPFLLDGQSVFVPRRALLVRVAGAVLHPGTYDLPPAGTTAGDLLELVGLSPDAAVERIELIQTAGQPQPGLNTMPREVPAAGTDGGASAGGLAAIENRMLQHGNQLLVPRVGGFARTDVATIEGEVRYPGAYSVAGERRVGDVVAAAGGLTPDAVASRVRLVRPLGNRPSTASATAPSTSPLTALPPAELTATEKELLRIRGIGDYRAVIVDLSAAGPDPGGNGPTLADGDRILVPRTGSYVEVTGRVRRPGFYSYEPNGRARDYVEKAGGYAERADKKGVRISAGPGDNFLLARDAGPPQPGDRIWVPERTPRSAWAITKDLLLVAAQVATIIIVIDQAGNN